MWLRQSTAITLKIGPFVDENDGKTAETGLTISASDVRLTKNGGDFAQKNEGSACTHDEIGWYNCPLNATDTNTLGRLQVAVHESGALPVFHEFMVIPAQVWDSLFGSDLLQVDATEISGDATAADNLEADYDGTGYNKSASTIGTVTSVAGLAAGVITAASIASDAITGAKIATGAISDSELAESAANEIADAVLKRGVSNVEDTADTTSLTALILAALESSISGTTWTIRKTGGATFVIKTVTVDSGADPITGVT